MSSDPGATSVETLALNVLIVKVFTVIDTEPVTVPEKLRILSLSITILLIGSMVNPPVDVIVFVTFSPGEKI
ncbi:hypothetical protein GCM10028773_58540 [Spirosoma koreense]